jgi:hypothetical protein
MDVDRLTRSTLFDLLRGDSENRKYFYNDLHDHVRHRSSWLQFRVCLKTLEESLDANEDVNQHILARIYIFGRLINVRAIIACVERSRMMLTKRRTPIPEKTTFAGENT